MCSMALNFKASSMTCCYIAPQYDRGWVLSSIYRPVMVLLASRFYIIFDLSMALRDNQKLTFFRILGLLSFPSWLVSCGKTSCKLLMDNQIRYFLKQLIQFQLLQWFQSIQTPRIFNYCLLPSSPHILSFSVPYLQKKRHFKCQWHWIFSNLSNYTQRCCYNFHKSTGLCLPTNIKNSANIKECASDMSL